MNPKVSIIIPVYNVEKYLDRCMNSVLNQTMLDIEIILVDDKSPDSSSLMCDEYAIKDQRVKVIHKKKNEGLGYARNTGLEIAKGEYICFVDSDDFVTQDMCEKLYSIAKRTDSDVVYGGVYYYDGNNVKIKKRVEKETTWRNEEVKKLLLDFIATEPGEINDTIIEVSVWKALFRKKVFDENNIRFVSERDFISEDVIFDIDYLQHCKSVTIISDSVYYYCENEESLSKSYRKDRFLKVKELYYELLNRLKVLYETDEINLRSDRFLIARARTNVRGISKNRKMIGKANAFNSIRDICEDKDLRVALERYPINKLPKKYYIVALLMKQKRYKLLSIVLSR